MFHPKKIAAKIKAIEQAKGIKLQENSIDDCARMYDHFRSLEVVTGKNKLGYSRPGQGFQNFSLSSQEQQWINNELYMCACSFPYWYFRYFFIQNKARGGIIQRPDPLVAQLVFIAILAELDLLGLPMLLLVLKARQLGISTIVEAIILWIAIFVKGCHNVIASAEEEKSEEMSNMIWVGLEMMPLWMQPVLTREDRTKGPEFGLIHSDILLQHGSQSKGISRGDTPVAAHLSEVAYYPDPEETIESSLIRAMHENPKTFLALESTARRKDDWFHRTWKSNREGEETGYNRFTCIFLPWYVGRDKYPTPDWLRNHPIPKHWEVVSDGKNLPWRKVQGKVIHGPLQQTYKQAADARLYVATHELLKKYMPEDWQMPPEQMWFWEFEYHAAREKGDRAFKIFLAELAADEKSCFQSKRWSVFEQDVLDRLEGEKNDDYQVYAMAGDGIDKKYHLLEFQSPRGKRIDISWQTITGDYLNWKLIPLREEPVDDKLKFYLKIWEHPKPNYNYTVGIDISSGIGQNRTVYFVNRIGKDEGEPDEEVALICSPWIPSPETPAFANMLGIYYGQYMSPLPEAMIAPEVQKAVGDFISFQLSKLGYSNFYYMERFDLRKQPGHRPTRRGWASMGWSQQMMEEAFEHGIKTGWIKINSQELLQELEYLESYETDSGRMVYDHADEQNNDVYVAGGIAYFVSHGHQTIMERMKGNLSPSRRKKKQDEDKKLDSGVTLMQRQLQMEDRAALGDLAPDEGEGDPLRYVY